MSLERQKLHKPTKGFDVDLSVLILPKKVRYYDDFADRMRAISSGDEVWKIQTDGEIAKIKWSNYKTPYRDFIQYFIVWAFSKYDPSTILNFASTITYRSEETRYWIDVFSRPDEAKRKWEATGYRNLPLEITSLLRAIINYMMELSLCGWSNADVDYVRGWKWFSGKKSSLAEHGHGYYIGSQEEHNIIKFFDWMASTADYSFDILLDACLLYLSYQFGFRPVQIASLARSDVATYSTSNNEVVHLTFYKAKQRNSQKREAILRKVKREWAPIFTKYLRMNDIAGDVRSDRVKYDSLFNLTPKEISIRISDASKAILGTRINANQFRHAAAQRMADLGMSQLELAEFMGQTHIDSCLVYFENSGTHAQVVNRALGLSPIYQKVLNFSKFGTLDHDELASIPPDNQIGGAAHGIALAGIGGCAIGQSLCKLSPAISCYTCPKFLPLHDSNFHRNIAEELSGVVKQFESAGRNDLSNPAFTQLTRTMTNIANIIDAIEAENE